MNSVLKGAAFAVAPSVLSKIKLRYIVFGVAAYYGLRLLKKQGYLPKQAESVLSAIDARIDMVKEKVGLHDSNSSAPGIH